MEKVAGTKQTSMGEDLEPLKGCSTLNPLPMLTAARFEVCAYRGGAMYASASFSGVSGTVPGHNDAERAVACPAAEQGSGFEATEVAGKYK